MFACVPLLLLLLHATLSAASSAIPAAPVMAPPPTKAENRYDLKTSDKKVLSEVKAGVVGATARATSSASSPFIIRDQGLVNVQGLYDVLKSNLSPVINREVDKIHKKQARDASKTTSKHPLESEEQKTKMDVGAALQQMYGQDAQKYEMYYRKMSLVFERQGTNFEEVAQPIRLRTIITANPLERHEFAEAIASMVPRPDKHLPGFFVPPGSKTIDPRLKALNHPKVDVALRWAEEQPAFHEQMKNLLAITSALYRADQITNGSLGAVNAALSAFFTPTNIETLKQVLSPLINLANVWNANFGAGKTVLSGFRPSALADGVTLPGLSTSLILLLPKTPEWKPLSTEQLEALEGPAQMLARTTRADLVSGVEHAKEALKEADSSIQSMQGMNLTRLSADGISTEPLDYDTLTRLINDARSALESAWTGYEQAAEQARNALLEEHRDTPHEQTFRNMVLFFQRLPMAQAQSEREEKKKESRMVGKRKGGLQPKEHGKEGMVETTGIGGGGGEKPPVEEILKQEEKKLEELVESKLEETAVAPQTKDKEPEAAHATESAPVDAAFKDLPSSIFRDDDYDVTQRQQASWTKWAWRKGGDVASTLWDWTARGAKQIAEGAQQFYGQGPMTIM